MTPPLPAHRSPRWRVGVGLLLAVLLLHGLLLDGLVLRPPPGAGRGREANPVWPMQVRSVATRPVGTDPSPDTALAAPTTGQHAGPPAAQRPGLLMQASTPAPMPEPTASPVPPSVLPLRTTVPAAAATLPTVRALIADAAAPEPLASSAAAADSPAPDSSALDSTQPPPVYPTRLPTPVRLRYTLQLNGQPGEAVLDWRHDGQHYTLTLEVHGGRVQPLLEQRSQGGFDGAGLAPERFTDRRRGRGQRAANFRRDIGRIGFSGPQIDYPAWPGAQDRLSWWAQLAAIQAAAVLAAAAPLPAITLFVVDANGAGDWWRFVPQGEAVLDTAVGRVATQHWRRDPEQADRFDSQRTEVWLDATRGQWPVLLRSTTLRSGEVFELRLSAEPGLPP